jgi:hypothetical protein
LAFNEKENVEIVEIILRIVKSYTEERLGLKNDFSPYFDMDNAFLKLDSPGMLDARNSRIILDYELSPEEILGVLAFFQPPAHLCYLTTNGEIMKTSEEIYNIIDKSSLLPGICKKVELDTIRYVKNRGTLDDYHLSKMEEDIMKLIMSNDEVEKLTKDEIEDLGFSSKYELIRLNRGYTICQELQRRARGHELEKQIIQASLRAAAESDDFDSTYEQLLDMDLDDIFTRGKIQIMKEPWDVQRIREDIEKVYNLIGKVKAGEATSAEIKRVLSPKNFGEELKRAGVNQKLLEAYQKFYGEISKISDKELTDANIKLIEDFFDIIRIEYLYPLGYKPKRKFIL